MLRYRAVLRPLTAATALIAAGAAAQAQTVLTASSWLSPTHILAETQ